MFNSCAFNFFSLIIVTRTGNRQALLPPMVAASSSFRRGKPDERLERGVALVAASSSFRRGKPDERGEQGAALVAASSSFRRGKPDEREEQGVALVAVSSSFRRGKPDERGIGKRVADPFYG
jgi:hypothetical protein